MSFSCFTVDQSSPIQAGATPIKRPKLQPLNDLTNRPLRSCPDLPSQKSFLPTVGNGGGGGGVTFCCPMVSNAGTGLKASRASPQFVVPKCFKVRDSVIFCSKKIFMNSKIFNVPDV